MLTARNVYSGWSGANGPKVAGLASIGSRIELVSYTSESSGTPKRNLMKSVSRCSQRGLPSPMLPRLVEHATLLFLFTSPFGQLGQPKLMLLGMFIPLSWSLITAFGFSLAQTADSSTLLLPTTTAMQCPALLYATEERLHPYRYTTVFLHNTVYLVVWLTPGCFPLHGGGICPIPVCRRVPCTVHHCMKQGGNREDRWHSGSCVSLPLMTEFVPSQLPFSVIPSASAAALPSPFPSFNKKLPGRCNSRH